MQIVLPTVQLMFLGNGCTAENQNHNVLWKRSTTPPNNAIGDASLSLNAIVHANALPVLLTPYPLFSSHALLGNVDAHVQVHIYGDST